MSKQKFVVFAVYDRDGSPACFYSTSRDRPEERTLPGLVNYAGNWKGQTLGTTSPFAWAVDDGSQIDQLRVDSVLAGRLIEKTASGWVALGAEKQEDIVRQKKFDAGVEHWVTSGNLPELRKVEPTSADLAMIARDGPKTIRIRKPVQLTVRVQSSAKPNPFPTTLRSPDCESGPSDHLNASRHQMAGMSKS
jgi:hypothetical protein